VLNLAGQLSLAGTTGVIAAAAAYVGPDTAATHIAAALGVPLLSFFGPTDPLKWGPWPKGYENLPGDSGPWRRLGDQAYGNVRLLQGVAACAPCGHEGCDRNIDSAADCLHALPASRVIAALSELLELSERH
jgi:heptosyltransferase-3